MRGIPITLCILGVLCTAGYGQNTKAIESQLQQKFVGRVGVLRGFYRDTKLQYDASGRVVGSPSPGVGPVDGSFYFAKISMHGRSLELTGDSAIPVWDPSTGKVSWHSVAFKRSVAIDASGLQDASDAEKRIFQVFFRAGESTSASCTDKEKERFKVLLERGMKSTLTTSAKPEVPLATEPAKSLEDVPRVCFPTGEIAYAIGKGVSPPKPRHTPDPSYTNVGLEARLTGFVDLMLIGQSRGRHPLRSS